MFYKIVRFILYLPIKILYPTKLVIYEKLPNTKAIIVCNHFTLVDILILIVLIKRPLYTWAKKELFKNKFLSWCYKQMHAIPVDRQNFGISTIKKSIDVLNNDKLLCIFPQGTRQTTMQESSKLKNGAILVALKTNTKVVPSMFISKPKIFKQNYLIIGKSWGLNKFNKKPINKDVLNEAGSILTQKMQDLLNTFQKNS